MIRGCEIIPLIRYARVKNDNAQEGSADLHAQIAAGHLCRLIELQEAQQSGRYIAQ